MQAPTKQKIFRQAPHFFLDILFAHGYISSQERGNQMATKRRRHQRWSIDHDAVAWLGLSLIGVLMFAAMVAALWADLATNTCAWCV